MPLRPRPRPNSILRPSSFVVGQNSEASTSSAALKIAKEDDEDEDDLFIRSKGRSLREVHKRAARAYLECPYKCASWGAQMHLS